MLNVYKLKQFPKSMNNIPVHVIDSIKSLIEYLESRKLVFEILESTYYHEGSNFATIDIRFEFVYSWKSIPVAWISDVTDWVAQNIMYFQSDKNTYLDVEFQIQLKGD